MPYDTSTYNDAEELVDYLWHNYFSLLTAGWH